MSATAPPDPPLDLEAWRRGIPLLRRAVPLAHCIHAPLHDRVREAVERWLAVWDREGIAWEEWSDEVEGARSAFARLIGARARDVAVSTSVTAATNGVASALDLSPPRDVIVTTEAEFPTVGHVWLAWARRGAEVRRVRDRDGVVAAEDVIAAIDERTRLVSLTHAAYRTGALLDVEAVARAARERGALVFVDAYQTVGARRIDVGSLGADFLASGCHKYLLGVPGIAFLWVRPELAERLRPAVTGWYGQAAGAATDPGRLDPAEGARRFELGTPPVPAACAARAGMEALLEVGMAAVEARLDSLSRRLVEGGEARGLVVCGTRDPRRKTALTAFRLPAPVAAETELRRRSILASARPPGIRLAPHFYSMEEEVDRALDALAEEARRQRGTGPT